MNGVGPAYQARAVRALFGPDRSPLLPAFLWVGWLDAADVLIAMSGTYVTQGSFAATGTGVSNAVALDCGVAGAGWAPIVSVAFYDASAGGDMVFAIQLPAPVDPPDGEPIGFPVGALTVAYGGA